MTVLVAESMCHRLAHRQCEDGHMNENWLKLCGKKQDEPIKCADCLESSAACRWVMGKVFSTRMLALHCPECGEPGYLTTLPAVRNSLSVRCKVYLQRLHSSSQIEIAATYPMRFEVRRVSSAIIECRWDAPKWMEILQICFPCFRSGNEQKPCIRTKVPGMLEVRATFARANAKPVVIWSEPYLWPPDKQVSRIKAVLLSKFGKERILQTHVEKGLSQRVGFTD